MPPQKRTWAGYSSWIGFILCSLAAVLSPIGAMQAQDSQRLRGPNEEKGWTIVERRDSLPIGQVFGQGGEYPSGESLVAVGTNGGPNFRNGEPGLRIPPTFDVSVPLAQSIASPGRAQWPALLSLSLVAIAMAVGGLIYFWRQNRELSTLLEQRTQLLEQCSRATALDLSNLGAGLAHEVRNPLHALRINLHILRRAIDGRASLPEDQLLATTRESDTAIDRIEGVLRDLLQFVEPTAGMVIDVDLHDEVQTVLGLLADGLARDQIVVEFSRGPQAAMISIDAARARQLLLNLLTFARLRVGKKGQIDLDLVATDALAELAIVYGGPSLTSEQAADLFKPFRSPIDSGSGLEMAVVHAHVLAAGGSLRYEPLNPPGNRFVLSLPIRRSAQKERQHEFQT
jgi:signal transduction histidine kinase